MQQPSTPVTPATAKDWPARCHVCGVEHAYRATWVSGSQYADGHLRVSCGQHTGPELYAAWMGAR